MNSNNSTKNSGNIQYQIGSSNANNKDIDCKNIILSKVIREKVIVEVRQK